MNKKYQENNQKSTLHNSQNNIEDNHTSSEITDKVIDKKKMYRNIAIEIATYILIFLICSIVVPRYVIQRNVVDGFSMENNFYDGQSVIVEKISKRLDMIDRFDVITFHPKNEESGKYYVKRVIALPGETIQIKGSDIYIDGAKIEENYGKDPISYAGIAAEPLTLGEDEYFVMGDNREISYDSRYEDVGIINKNDIVGRVILRIWPLSDFGLVK